MGGLWWQEWEQLCWPAASRETNWFFLSVVLIGSLQPVDALLDFALCVCVDMQFMKREYIFVFFFLIKTAAYYFASAGDNHTYNLYHNFHFK